MHDVYVAARRSNAHRSTSSFVATFTVVHVVLTRSVSPLAKSSIAYPGSSRKPGRHKLLPAATSLDVDQFDENSDPPALDLNVDHSDTVTQDEVRTLVQTLPDDLRAQLLDHPELDDLVEVVLDLGRKPQANFGQRRDYIRESVVTTRELDHVVSCVGEFGGDNRAGIEGTLHRVSCIRNRSGVVIGLTLGVGKPVIGPATMLDDILQERKSVLVLGAPGVGKTTVIRDVARVLSDKMGRRVMIVDTSNEIGGYGNIPHPFIGEARRMQVPNIEEQYNVMTEAVQNHRPEVVIVDEVGRQEEVDACRSIGERGVQIIATVHGHTLENLVKNPQLVGLVGGIQTVTLGDMTAIKRAGDLDFMKKMVREREGPSAFDVLVEMRSRDEWYIHDVETSVDQVIKGQEVRIQVRSMDSATGAIRMRTSIYTSSSVLNILDEESTQEDEVGGKIAPLNMHLSTNEHRAMCKKILKELVCKKLQDKHLPKLGVEKLHSRAIKTTEKKMKTVLSKPSEIKDGHPQSTVDSDVDPLIGRLELWVTAAAEERGIQLSQTECEGASHLLAAHAVGYIQQCISSLTVENSGSGSSSNEETLQEPVPERTMVESGLEPLLIGLIQCRKPKLKNKQRKTAERKVLKKISDRLDKLWENPENIGGKQSGPPKIKKKAEKKVFAKFQSVVQDAGKGVQNIDKDKVEKEAHYLFRLAIGNL